MSDWIMTASGVKFYPTQPRIQDIRIEDIAHGLAAVSRFGGHTREPYSVGQHSYHASQLLESMEGPRAALYGLLHDASEAYLGDVPRPLKHLLEFEGYRAAEQRLQEMVYLAFGLSREAEPVSLKDVDRRLLRTEQRSLMPPAAPAEDRHDVEPYTFAVVPWSFMDTRARFLARFQQLQRHLAAALNCHTCRGAIWVICPTCRGAGTESQMAIVWTRQLIRYWQAMGAHTL